MDYNSFTIYIWTVVLLGSVMIIRWLLGIKDD